MNIQGLPSVGMALAPSATKSMAAASDPTSPSSTQTADSAEQTFIKLLVTEMQSQDPTSPMDPTTMVGQMFQMNQLQQLIDINQTLSNALTPTPSSSTSSASTSHSNLGTSVMHAVTSMTPPNVAASYARQLLTGVN
jgi:flagellar basal-body rod modification protein FlgD